MQMQALEFQGEPRLNFSFSHETGLYVWHSLCFSPQNPKILLLDEATRWECVMDYK